MREYKLKAVFIEAERLVQGNHYAVVGKGADVNLAGVFAVESGSAFANTGKGLFGMGSELVEGTILRCADNNRYFVRTPKENFLSRYAVPAAPEAP